MSVGVDRVMAKLRTHAQAAMNAGRIAARVQGERVVATAKGMAPRDDGELIASIRAEDTATFTTKAGPTEFIGVLVKAGDETTKIKNSRGKVWQNARLQEFGTQKMPANPFFYPAWRLNKSAVRAAITRAVRAAWRGVG